MRNSEKQKILGVIIDNKLTFKSHVKNLCKKDSQRVWALARLLPKVPKWRKIIRSQFNYCPIVWMFCSRQTNNMINKLHERTLRIELKDQTSNFETLLAESSDICNYHRNIQTLMT